MNKKLYVRSINRRNLYKVNEAAKALRVCTKTIYSMIKDGLLVVNNNSNPLFIKGQDLLDFVKKKEAKFKVNLKDDQFFCFRCKTGVTSTSDEFKILFTRKKWGRYTHLAKLTGRCNNCGSIIYKINTEERIIDLVKKGIFDQKHISVLIETDNSK